MTPQITGRDTLQPYDHAKSEDIAYRSLVGSPIIDFATRSTMGEVRLLAFARRWVLLFCHPADFTPGCTSEFVTLAQEQEKFAEMGIQLLGLSVDSVFNHMGWIEWIDTKFNFSVNFPVIEDVSMDISRVYGLVDAYSDTTSTVRACLFIDLAQKVQALIHYPMHIGCGFCLGWHQGLVSAGDAPDQEIIAGAPLAYIENKLHNKRIGA